MLWLDALSTLLLFLLPLLLSPGRVDLSVGEFQNELHFERRLVVLQTRNVHSSTRVALY